MLMAYSHYKNGFMPNAGGWMDQAYTYTEAMRFIEQRVKGCEKKEFDG